MEMEIEIVVPGAGLDVPGSRIDFKAPLVFTLPDVFDAAECDAEIARAEAIGFHAAPITTGAGFVMRRDIRNNTRVMRDDPALAAELFQRIRDRLPQRLFGRRPAGVNERFRYYRYEPGERFAAHYDGCYERNPSERSELTFMVYLNEGFSGGATAFLDAGAVVTPRRGAALLFQHCQLHEGGTVLSGTKYVLRSDVMYAD